jgi:hypothetical protein
MYLTEILWVLRERQREHRPVSVQFLFLAAEILQNMQRYKLDLLLLLVVLVVVVVAAAAAIITVEGRFQSAISCLIQFPNHHSNFIYSHE